MMKAEPIVKITIRRFANHAAGASPPS